MCLEKVNIRPRNLRKHGYKVFRRGNDDELHSHLFGTGRPREVEVWIEDEPAGYMLHAEVAKEQYSYGFHVFTNKKSARLWADTTGYMFTEVWKVEFSGMLAYGPQHLQSKDGKHRYGNVVVVRKMKILEKVN